jgi:hypothetical protein
MPLGLNGVHQPFWGNWGNADPSIFLTPDALHVWHKFFFDHPLKWIINIMGGEELDCCMVLHPVNSDQNYDYIQNSGPELRLDLLNIFTDYPYAYGLTITHMLTSHIVHY